jgi:hypothetical protein
MSAMASVDRTSEPWGTAPSNRSCARASGISASAAEAVLVADRLREGFGLVEDDPRPFLLAEREERVAEIEAEVEGLGDRGGSLRQPPERVERLLEVVRRPAVGRAQ